MIFKYTDLGFFSGKSLDIRIPYVLLFMRIMLQGNLSNSDILLASYLKYSCMSFEQKMDARSMFILIFLALLIT
jgi:hypothetical protein